MKYLSLNSSSFICRLCFLDVQKNKIKLPNLFEFSSLVTGRWSKTCSIWRWFLLQAPLWTSPSQGSVKATWWRGGSIRWRAGTRWEHLFPNLQIFFFYYFKLPDWSCVFFLFVFFSLSSEILHSGERNSEVLQSAAGRKRASGSSPWNVSTRTKNTRSNRTSAVVSDPERETSRFSGRQPGRDVHQQEVQTHRPGRWGQSLPPEGRIKAALSTGSQIVWNEVSHHLFVVFFLRPKATISSTSGWPSSVLIGCTGKTRPWASITASSTPSPWVRVIYHPWSHTPRRTERGWVKATDPRVGPRVGQEAAVVK